MQELDPIRMKGFGASEIAAACNMDDEGEDLDALHAKKVRGLIQPPVPFYFDLGHIFEGPILDGFTLKTKKPVEKLFTKTFVHPRYPHIMATPDGLLLEESAIVDAKFLGNPRAMFMPLREPGDMPHRWQLQAAGSMEVLDRDRFYFCILRGNELIIIQQERDREFGEWLMRELTKLWERYFEGDERPPIGGSKTTSLWLKQHYNKQPHSDIRPATDEEIELLAEYVDLRIEEKALLKNKQKLENQLKDAIKNREGLSWPGGRVTWKKTRDSKKVDWHSLVVTLFQNFVKDADAQKKLTEDHTGVIQGYRRLDLRAVKYSEADEAQEAEDAA